MLSGLASVVDGVGSLRTHIGSAHGRGRKSYSVHARRARLAVHASHTLVAFVLETWGQRRRGSQCRES
ncbi:MAG: abortive infection family protein [Rhodospirillales bacterium]|nr:abortive infection family protein [Rhodospirillales bacterium]